MTRLFRSLVFVLVATLLLSGPAASQAMDPLSAEETEAVEKVIERYLLANPELLLRVIERLEAQQQAQREENLKQQLAVNRDALVESEADLVLGNPEGDVTVVEFFDYRCSFCKRAHPIMESLVEEDPDVRLVMKEFPILGPDSVIASQAALASREQGLYAPYFDALMEHEGNLTEQDVYDIATEVGLDLGRLREDMASDAVRETIAANLQLARTLGIDGTPTLIIGDRLIPGVADLGRLETAIEEARASCVTC